MVCEVGWVAETYLTVCDIKLCADSLGLGRENGKEYSGRGFS